MESIIGLALSNWSKQSEKSLFIVPLRSFENGGGGSQSRVPALDTLMSTCPSLNTLKIDLRMSTLALAPHPQKINMDKLTKLSVGLYLTKAAFEWLWTNAANLEVKVK